MSLPRPPFVYFDSFQRSVYSLQQISVTNGQCWNDIYDSTSVNYNCIRWTTTGITRNCSWCYVGTWWSVWPDWAIFERSDNKCSYKSSLNIWWLLGLFFKWNCFEYIGVNIMLLFYLVSTGHNTVYNTCVESWTTRKPPLISVTRFGEISPLGQNFTNVWKNVEC